MMSPVKQHPFFYPRHPINYPIELRIKFVWVELREKTQTTVVNPDTGRAKWRGSSCGSQKSAITAKRDN